MAAGAAVRRNRQVGVDALLARVSGRRCFYHGVPPVEKPGETRDRSRFLDFIREKPGTDHGFSISFGEMKTVVCPLFSSLRNFVELPADQLLERMVGLSLRTEEQL